MPTPKFNPEKPHCLECDDRPATLFVTKTVGNKVVKQNFCEPCARRLTAQKLGDRAIHAPLEDILRVLFQHNLIGGANKPSSLEETAASPDWWHSLVEYSADEDVADAQAEAMDELDERDVRYEDMRHEDARHEDARHEIETLGDDSSTRDHLSTREDETEGAKPEQDGFAQSSLVPSQVPSQRCPKCGTTWDRLKQDGRVGCAGCYSVFGDELSQVMEKMQGSALHEGKVPRTMDKRQKRLMHLRLRRDHRLQMLQRRLDECLAKEDYEEAAKVRDKIKMVSSTILEE